LKKAVTESHAVGGCVIIMDPHQGEILAMASYPDFNPNHYAEASPQAFLNKAVQTVYEPGSTLKAITMASAINEHVVAPDTKIECPGAFKVLNRTITDSHAHGTEIKTVTDILAESINIGTGKVGLLLGHTRLYHYLRQFGFGALTKVQLPGESGGILTPLRYWSDLEDFIIPFGQSIAVTPIQLITAISAIANGGTIYQPKLIKYLESEDGKTLIATPTHALRRVISEDTAKTLREMMIKVTTEGTATNAKIYGYDVAGKTGTAQKVSPTGGYLKNRFVSSFIGFLPADHPKAVILVVIDDPDYEHHFGSTCASPAFKAIAEETIRYLSIPPR
jgi:cell division protein FtsI/penicillin-binding protein 2